MKLKFLRTVPLGSGGHYDKGQTVDVKDQHAAELYVAHGDAVAVEGTVGSETLKRSFPKGAATTSAPQVTAARPQVTAKGAEKA